MANYITPIEYNKTKEQVSLNNNDTRIVEYSLRLDQLQAQLNNMVVNFTGYSKLEIDSRINIINQDINSRVTSINTELQKLQNAINTMRTEFTVLINNNNSDIDPTKYATRTEFNSLTNSINSINSQINNINDNLNSLPNFNNYYTKNEIQRNYYDKTTIDSKLDSVSGLDSTFYYKKNEVDSKIDAISKNINTTFKNYYNKNEVDAFMRSFDSDGFYTRNEIDNRINNINSSISAIQGKFYNYYNKTEVDSALSSLENRISPCKTDTSCPTYTTPCTNNTVPCTSNTTPCSSNTTPCSSHTTPTPCTSNTTPCTSNTTPTPCSSNTAPCSSNTDCPTNFMCVAKTTTCPSNYICIGNTQCIAECAADTSCQEQQPDCTTNTVPCPNVCASYIGCEILDTCTNLIIQGMPYNPTMLGKSGKYELNIPADVKRILVYLVGGGAAGTSNYQLYTPKLALDYILKSKYAGNIAYNHEFANKNHIFYGKTGNMGQVIENQYLEVKEGDLITITIGKGGINNPIININEFNASSLEFSRDERFDRYWQNLVLLLSKNERSGEDSTIAVNNVVKCKASGGVAYASDLSKSAKVRDLSNYSYFDRITQKTIYQPSILNQIVENYDFINKGAANGITNASGMGGDGGYEIKNEETINESNTSDIATPLTNGKSGNDGFTIIFYSKY